MCSSLLWNQYLWRYGNFYEQKSSLTERHTKTRISPLFLTIAQGSRGTFLSLLRCWGTSWSLSYLSPNILNSTLFFRTNQMNHLSHRPVFISPFIASFSTQLMNNSRLASRVSLGRWKVVASSGFMVEVGGNGLLVNFFSTIRGSRDSQDPVGPLPRNYLT